VDQSDLPLADARSGAVLAARAALVGERQGASRLADKVPRVNAETPAEPASVPPPNAAPATPRVPSEPPVPDDAGDTRSLHMRRLARHPLTLIGGGAVVLAVLLVAGTQVGWGIGAIGAAVALLVVGVAVLIAANAAARDDFFTAYAQGRGLDRVEGHTPLPPLTPLLSKGDRRYAEERFNGVLPGDLDGSLCLYTYEEQTTDSDGNRQTTYVHHTIVLAEIPATAPLIQELFCQRRVGFRFMDSMEDAFRKRQRVEQESAAVDKEFEIFTGANDDLARARQILSPTFLVWLESHAPEDYAFELVAGSLVCNLKGHKKAATELDQLCIASAAVARRLQEEAAELGSAPIPPPPL
jgi:hypothetical protein